MFLRTILILCFVARSVDGFVSPTFRSKPRQTAFHAQVPQILVDLCVAGSLGFGTDPLIEAVYNATSLERGEKKDVKETFIYGAADSVSVAARLYGLVILSNWVATEFHLEGPIAVDMESPRQVALEIAFSVWMALTLSAFKRFLLLQWVDGTRLGRVHLIDSLADFVLVNFVLVMICNQLSIDIGMGFKSVFAAGGVGALVFGLASKGLAEQIFGGIAIRLWDAFEVGDNVVLGDGTEGTIFKIGLVETAITGYDNIVIRVPNSQLSSQRVSNISRIRQSRVQQHLRFKYSDLKALEDNVLDDIVAEIKAACPKVITDGSKPLNALLAGYQPDHVEVVVNSHFEIPPGSADYSKNRQEVLLAIARAVDKNGVQFALPSISYRTEGNSRSGGWAP